MKRVIGVLLLLALAVPAHAGSWDDEDRGGREEQEETWQEKSQREIEKSQRELEKIERNRQEREREYRERQMIEEMRRLREDPPMYPHRY